MFINKDENHSLAKIATVFTALITDLAFKNT